MIFILFIGKISNHSSHILFLLDNVLVFETYMVTSCIQMVFRPTIFLITTIQIKHYQLSKFKIFRN